MSAVVKVGSAAHDKLVAILHSGSASLRWLALRTFNEMVMEMEPPEAAVGVAGHVAELLKDPDGEVRHLAAALLARLGPER